MRSAGVVEADETGFFSISRLVARARRYPATGGQHEQEVWLRVLHAIFSDDIPDTRDIVIISLANACDVFRQMLSPEEYAEARERIELISRLELLSRSVTDGIRNLTLAEAYARRRGIQEKGGGWPRASGHLASHRPCASDSAIQSMDF